MKIERARNHPETLTEITVGIGETDRRTVTLERIDKHTIECRFGDAHFAFRTRVRAGRTRPTGPGIEMRHTNRTDYAHAHEQTEVDGQPGMLEMVCFDTPITIHIEEMDKDFFSCSIGDHHFEVKAPGKAEALELVPL